MTGGSSEGEGPGRGISAGAPLPLPLAGEGPLLRPGGVAAALAELAAAAPPPWRDQLHEEPAVLAAQIVAFRPDDALAAFDIAAEAGAAPLRHHVREVAQRLQDWLVRARAQLPEVFADTLDTLDSEMDLHHRVRRLASGGAAEPDPPRPDADPFDEARRMRAAMGAAHHQMVHAMASLQPAAQAALRARLASGTVDPAIGLLVAELEAAALVETRLNGFSRRHTDFYFSDMLGQHPAPARPERVLLHVPPGSADHLLPPGARLIARSTAGGVSEFRTLLAAPLTTARVTATAGITYETDPQVSAHAALGAVTRVVASFDPPDRPIERNIFKARLQGPPQLGLEISSDMLSLREGRREIEVRLEMHRATMLPAVPVPGAMRRPGQDPDPEVLLELTHDRDLMLCFGHATAEEGAAAVAAAIARRPEAPSMSLIYEILAERAPAGPALRALLGRIVTLGLVEGAPWPSGRFWELLRGRLEACRDELSGQRVGDGRAGVNSILADCFAKDAEGRFLFSPGDVFQKFFADTFEVTLTSAAGPVRPDVLQVLPNGAGEPPGLTFRMALGPGRPAIGPPAGEDDAAPAMTIRYGSGTRICPVSFFERYEIARVGLRLRVSGLRRVAAFNDEGPVAADQSFLPFGSRPVDGATLTLAVPEMAAKPISQVSVELEWADLPAGAGGFAGHYAGYPAGTRVPDPKVTAGLLADEGWIPLLREATPLVDRDQKSGVLLARWQRRGSVERLRRPDSAAARTGLPRGRGELRSGAVRLTLSGMGDGTAQLGYTMALAQAMRPRMLPFRRVRALPNPPWLPRLAALRLGYEASDTIQLSDHETARPRDRVRQITPFGAIEVFPARIGRRLGLFPARLGYGTLLIQLAGPTAKEQLSLLFDIADGGHERVVPPRVPLVWHYLTDSGWQPLPATAVTSDTTDGLLRSGTIVLDLPDDASETAPEMPPGGLWLAVSADRPGFETYPRLTSVRTNGIWATGASGAAAELAPGPRDWRFDPGFPGLGTPVEIGRRLPPRPPETPHTWRARVAARLRHRARAVTPWDVECLVREEFPEVWHARCLPHLSHESRDPAPGRATVVLVRHPPPPGADGTVPPLERHFDVSKLARVRDFLGRISSPFARFEVVNPAFDRIQVRAQLRFGRESQDSAQAHRLRQHLVRHLSIWTASPDLARFGWSLNVALLRARIAALDYVEELSDFSVLHFASDDRGFHRLVDTARAGPGETMQVILPSSPWALPLSAPDHAIEPGELALPVEARPTGVGRLRVGDMLIVGQEATL